MNICSIPNCDNKYYAKGWCGKHYKRWQTTGTLETSLLYLSGSNEYGVWKSMKQRCYNPKNKKYKDYGARGIDISPEWLNSFKTFISDMGFRPTDRHTIDRIDNNKGYSKDNCRWITYREQNYNQRLRKDNTAGHVGVSFSKSKNKWRSYKDGKHIGYFNLLKDAILARESL